MGSELDGPCKSIAITSDNKNVFSAASKGINAYDIISSISWTSQPINLGDKLIGYSLSYNSAFKVSIYKCDSLLIYLYKGNYL